MLHNFFRPDFLALDQISNIVLDRKLLVFTVCNLF